MKQNYKSITSAILVSVSGYLNAQCPTPNPVTASPSVICAGATTSLNATAVGNSINWYTVGVGGTPIGSSPSGVNYSVSPVTTTTYYAESFDPGTITYTYTGALQQYTVPAGVTQITITAIGAAGGSLTANGNYLGGTGTSMQGVFAVTPGNVLNVVVGGKGNSDPSSSGGGGGSGVGLGGTPLIVAGGGAGVDFQQFGYTGRHAVIATSGVAGGGGGGAGGVSGANGADYVFNANNTSRGGRGWTFNNAGSTGLPGLSINTTTTAGTWGLGGGGGSVGYGFCNCGGGGGGYSGGGSGSANNSGGGGGSFNSGNNQVNTAQVGTGSGSVIITGAGCVSAQRAAIVVTVNPVPVITVNSGSICSGNSFTINPSGANTYTIQGGNAVVNPTITTNYTVVGTSSAGCVSQVVTSSITVNALPLPTISVNSGSICSGSSFTITPSGANTYTIQGGNAVVNPTTTSSYTVTGTNSVGCVSQSVAVSNITVVALPSLSVAGTGSICKGTTVTFTASGANTYSWNTGAVTSTITQSPSVTTNYTAMGTSTAGCTSTFTFALLVDPCTGINTNTMELKNIAVYPNPVSNELIIEVTTRNEKLIQITDFTGRIVYSEKTEKTQVKVNMTGFSAGIYHVKVQGENTAETIKIIKQ